MKHTKQLDWIATQQSQMQRQLMRLASINSCSGNVLGNRDVATRYDELMSGLGAQRSRITMPAEKRVDATGRLVDVDLGSAWSWSKRPYAPIQILLLSHSDTVFHEDHQFQQVSIVHGGRLQGPAVADSKGGLMVMWAALAALERSPYADRIGWTVLLNPDEELGSVCSNKFILQQAQHHHLALVFEPSTADGQHISTRSGAANYSYIIRGKEAHSGQNPQQGRNAVLAAARLALQLNELNDHANGLTVTPAMMQGGKALNMVPDCCVLRVNIRLQKPAQQQILQQQLEGLEAEIASTDGFTVERLGAMHRPVKSCVGQPQQALMTMLQHCAAQLHQPGGFRASGGGCDGNNLLAAGLPTLDTMGVIGGNFHTEGEWMRLSSLTERAQLSALLMLQLAEGEFDAAQLRQQSD